MGGEGEGVVPAGEPGGRAGEGGSEAGVEEGGGEGEGGWGGGNAGKLDSEEESCDWRGGASVRQAGLCEGERFAREAGTNRREAPYR